MASIFSQDNLIAWWNAKITQSFGSNGEKGVDYGLGGMGKPVGSITSGKVVYVGNGGYPGSSIGQIVQVQGADGSLVHYQHLMSSNVSLGQTVNPGDIVGQGGGCPVGAYFSDPSNNGCKFYDAFSSGQHIEVRYSPSYNPSKGVWSQAWQDPQQIFAALGTGQAQGGPLTGILPGFPSLPSLPNLDFKGIGIKIAVFILGIVLLMISIYILFQPQVEGAAKEVASALTTAGGA